MKMFIEASETHESEISQMFLPTDNPLFFQLKVHSEIDNVLSLTNIIYVHKYLEPKFDS